MKKSVAGPTVLAQKDTGVVEDLVQWKGHRVSYWQPAHLTLLSCVVSLLTSQSHQATPPWPSSWRGVVYRSSTQAQWRRLEWRGYFNFSTTFISERRHAECHHSLTQARSDWLIHIMPCSGVPRLQKLRYPSVENPELTKCSPFRARSRSEHSPNALPAAMNFFLALISIVQVHSPSFFFF